MDANSVWRAVLTDLELSLSKPYFAGYIKPLSLVALEVNRKGVVATILCPTKYQAEMLENRYGRHIKGAIERVVEKPCELVYEIGKEEVGRATSDLPLFQPSQKTSAPGSGSHNLNPRLTFDTYIVGSSNNFAYAAAHGAAKSPGTRYNPLFIYGGVGLGKTHLMQAIGHMAHTEHPDWEIMYISAETFGSDLIASLQNKKTAAFKKKYRSPNVLLIDDVQFIAGKEYIQEEFFHTFNELYMSGRQIVLTSDRPPQEISRLEERLSSRFMGGLMVDVQPPDFETRVAILSQKCKTLGLELPPDLIALLAEKAVGNIRELEGALQAVLARAAAENSAIDAELIREHFGASLERRGQRARPNTIIARAAAYYNYKVKELTGKSRKAPLTAARHAAMYLLYEELSLPYTQIGEMFGGRDHTSVMHAVGKIRSALKTDSALSLQIADIRQSI